MKLFCFSFRKRGKERTVHNSVDGTVAKRFHCIEGSANIIGGSDIRRCKLAAKLLCNCNTFERKHEEERERECECELKTPQVLVRKLL